jgi:hypothetical protein
MDGDFDFNVMMDLDDEFARDHGGYGSVNRGPFPYDPTFNPHGVGAYSEFDGSDYDYESDQNNEYSEWEEPSPTIANSTRDQISSTQPTLSQVLITDYLK